MRKASLKAAPTTYLCIVMQRLSVYGRYISPGLSKKDRIARQMVEDATASGALQPGQTVVEATSGNTGYHTLSSRRINVPTARRWATSPLGKRRIFGLIRCWRS